MERAMGITLMLNYPWVRP